MAVGNEVVKDTKKVTVESGRPVAVSFDKKQLDSFDLWSENRARDLIALNKRLSQRTLASNTSSLGFNSNAWVYSRQCGCYTFLPFGSGFSSPYGWDYSVCNPFWNPFAYYWPWGNGYYYGGRPSWGNNNGGGTSSGGGSTAGGGGGISNGGGRHKPGIGDRETPGIPRPPVRIDGGAHASQPSWGGNGDGPRYNGPVGGSVGGGGGHHNSSPSYSGGGSSPSFSRPSGAPSMPSSSPAAGGGGGGGHHNKN